MRLRQHRSPHLLHRSFLRPWQIDIWPQFGSYGCWHWGRRARWRIKWIFAAGLGFGVLRYWLAAMDGEGWILAGITLHGCSYTLVFITSQIYLDERVDAAWRARAQALLYLLTSGFGNLVGYLGSGLWLRLCSQGNGTNWSRFWGGLSASVAVLLVYFLWTYRGRNGSSVTPG